MSYNSLKILSKFFIYRLKKPYDDVDVLLNMPFDSITELSWLELMNVASVFLKSYYESNMVRCDNGLVSDDC